MLVWGCVWELCLGCVRRWHTAAAAAVQLPSSRSDPGWQQPQILISLHNRPTVRAEQCLQLLLQSRRLFVALLGSGVCGGTLL